MCTGRRHTAVQEGWKQGGAVGAGASAGATLAATAGARGRVRGLYARTFPMATTALGMATEIRPVC